MFKYRLPLPFLKYKQVDMCINRQRPLQLALNYVTLPFPATLCHIPHSITPPVAAFKIKLNGRELSFPITSLLCLACARSSYICWGWGGVGGGTICLYYPLPDCIIIACLLSRQYNQNRSLSTESVISVSGSWRNIASASTPPLFTSLQQYLHSRWCKQNTCSACGKWKCCGRRCKPIIFSSIHRVFCWEDALVSVTLESLLFFCP